MRINVKTGRVLEVRVTRSTSHTMLDKAAVGTLSDWRFKPGCLNPTFGKGEALVTIPVTFALPE
jgi:TonB family protein